MRRLRMAICIFFGLSCVCFGVYTVKEMLTKDKNVPVITCEDEVLHVGEHATEEELLAGVTAKDKEDGDITDRVQVASISRFLGNGERTIQYIVFDSANQLGTLERTLAYDDYVSPKIYLKEPLRFTKDKFEEGMRQVEMQATDYIDGDLSANIRTSYGKSMYDVEPGNYPVTLHVNNSAGDSRILALELTIVDGSDESRKYYPLLENYIAYTTIGKKVDYESFLIGIESNSEEYLFGDDDIAESVSVSDISIKSNVDYDTPGVYTVNYSYISQAGLKATTVLYVVVEE